MIGEVKKQSRFATIKEFCSILFGNEEQEEKSMGYYMKHANNEDKKTIEILQESQQDIEKNIEHMQKSNLSKGVTRVSVQGRSSIVEKKEENQLQSEKKEELER